MKKQQVVKKVVNRNDSRLTPEMRRKISTFRVAMTEKGLTLGQIAKELDMKYGTVQHTILRFLTRQTFSLQGKQNKIIFLYLKRHGIDLNEISAGCQLEKN